MPCRRHILQSSWNLCMSRGTTAVMLFSRLSDTVHLPPLPHLICRLPLPHRQTFCAQSPRISPSVRALTEKCEEVVHKMQMQHNRQLQPSFVKSVAHLIDLLCLSAMKPCPHFTNVHLMVEAAGCAASAFCAQPPRTSPSVPGLTEKCE